MLGSARRIAMEYSPRCAIPYVSRVDAGTLEMVRGLGVEVVSSADLVQAVEARLSPQQIDGHRRAAAALLRIKDETFAHVTQALRAGQPISEYSVQQWMAGRIAEAGLVADHDPIVAVNAHAADPHYIPTAQRHAPIQRGDFLLLDLWARETAPDAIMGDITWVALCSDRVPPRYQHICDVVAQGRDAAVAFIQERDGGRPAGARLRRRRRLPRCDRAGRLWPLLHPPHRPLVGLGRPRQRRAPGQSGDQRHPPPAARDGLHHRARHLPPRRLRRAPGDRRAGPRGGIEITTLPLQREIVALVDW
jgi:hypothetical protein